MKSAQSKLLMQPSIPQNLLDAQIEAPTLPNLGHEVTSNFMLLLSQVEEGRETLKCLDG